jgi:hypothetical protein
VSETFQGFSDDDIASANKLNNDILAGQLAGDTTPYDFESHADASTDEPGQEIRRSFIDHWRSGQ